VSVAACGFIQQATDSWPAVSCSQSLLLSLSLSLSLSLWRMMSLLEWVHSIYFEILNKLHISRSWTNSIFRDLLQHVLSFSMYCCYFLSLWLSHAVSRSHLISASPLLSFAYRLIVLLWLMHTHGLSHAPAHMLLLHCHLLHSHLLHSHSLHTHLLHRHAPTLGLKPFYLSLAFSVSRSLSLSLFSLSLEFEHALFRMIIAFVIAHRDLMFPWCVVDVSLIYGSSRFVSSSQGSIPLITEISDKVF